MTNLLHTSVFFPAKTRAMAIKTTVTSHLFVKMQNPTFALDKPFYGMKVSKSILYFYLGWKNCTLTTSLNVVTSMDTLTDKGCPKTRLFTKHSNTYFFQLPK